MAEKNREPAGMEHFPYGDIFSRRMAYFSRDFTTTHMMEIAAEIGSQEKLIDRLATSDDGSRVSFYQGTKTGSGLFIYDSASGQKRLFYEDPGTNLPIQTGWSPDGKLLAFRGQRKNTNRLLICNADSGQIETAVDASTHKAVWLSSSSLVFFNGALRRVDKRPDSSWCKPYYFSAVKKKGKKSQVPNKPGVKTVRKYPVIQNLMAISPHSVAWVGWNAIWEWKFHADAPTKIWESSSNTLVGYDYSRVRGAFLLHLRDATGDRLAAFYPDRQQLVNIDNLTNSNVTDALWINHGKGYAYLLNESGLHSIFIKADCGDRNPPLCIPQDGIKVITHGSGNYIYAVGSLNNQPRGIIEYNIASGAARYAVPNPANFHYTKNIIVSTGIVTNSFGEVHAYNLWTPINFNPRKKYPLVITQEVHLWNPYAEAAANAGAYYISVERPGFTHPQIEHWTEDVMAAYQLMAKNPNIDTNNVYLCGDSAETAYVIQLLDQEPALWKGAMLISPVAYPNLSQTRIAKLLINCGRDDEEYHAFDRIKSYQEQAARVGIPVTVAAHSAGHLLVSQAANTESIQQFVRLLFN